MDDSININIHLQSPNLNSENVVNWIYSMCYFEPVDMISKKLTGGKVKKFNSKQLKVHLKEEIENTDRISVMIKDESNTISVNRGIIKDDIATLSCNLNYDIYEKNK